MNLLICSGPNSIYYCNLTTANHPKKKFKNAPTLVENPETPYCAEPVAPGNQSEQLGVYRSWLYQKQNETQEAVESRFIELYGNQEMSGDQKID